MSVSWQSLRLATARGLRRASLRLARRLAILAALAAPSYAHAPHDTAYRVALSPAFPTDGTVLAHVMLSDHDYLARSTDGGKSWLIRSDPMLALGLNDIVFSPQYAVDATVFAATKGGVFRSTDGGLTFELSSAGLFDPEVRAIAPSPLYADEPMLLATTPSGCFRSVDGGVSWAPSSVGLVEAGSVALALGVEAGQVVAYTGTKVLHRSTDGGLSWAPVQLFGITMAALETLASDAQTVAVCFGRFGQGVTVSTDGGTSFAPFLAGLPDLQVNALRFGGDRTLFAATRNVGVFRADTLAGPWVALPDGLDPLSDQTSDHFTDLDVSPAYAADSTVYVAAFEGLFRSPDAGQPWVQCDVYNQRLNRRLVFSPSYATDRSVWVGNYGGGPALFRVAGAATPGVRPGPGLSGAGEAALPFVGGVSPGPQGPGGAGKLASPWSARSAGLPLAFTDVLLATPDHAASGTLFYGYVGFYRSDDFGLSWTKLDVPGQVVRAAAVSPAWPADPTLFVGTGGLGAYRSLDGGKSFTLMDAGLPPTHTASMIVVSPAFTVDATAFISSKALGVHRTTDGGETWQLLRGLPAESAVFLAVSPAYGVDTTVYAGMEGSGVWVSIDGGDSWAPSNGGLPEDEPLIVEGLALSPEFVKDGTMFVTLRDQGIHRSLDYGRSWQPSGAGLPLDAQRVVEISPAFAADRTVLLSTHGWLYVSRDAGGSWQRLPGFARTDDQHPSVTRSAGWATIGSTANQFGSVAATGSAGAWIEHAFQGDSVAVIAATGPLEGNIAVTLDGVPVAQVSLAAESAAPQTRVWSRTFAQVGWHVVRVVHVGPTAGNPNPGVRLDGFESTY